MLQVSDEFKQAMISPVRSFAAQVEVRQNPNNISEITLLTDEDRVKTIEIQRVGDNSKFYGYGICQRLNLKLIDLADDLHPIPSTSVMVRIGIKLDSGMIEYVNWPHFYITERNRSEEDGEISIVAYDKLDEATLHTVAELEIKPPYTIKEFAQSCATFLGLGFSVENIPDDDYAFGLLYEEGANFSGTESIRQALNSVAEATSTIYFIDNEDRLRFKRLDISGEPLAIITDEDYFTLTHSDNRRVTKVMHATELGDNVSSELTITGSTAYVRNNPFWEMREDIATIVDEALANVGGLTINQFDCSWRGNLPLECGDKIDMQQVCLDGCVESAFVLDDVISFDGSFKQQTQWSYQGSNAETDSNPSTIGDALNHTYARVDKINRQIDLVASETESNSSEISAIKINTDSINLSVEILEKSLDDSLEDINNNVNELTKKVEATMTEEDFIIKINETLENGVSSVTTSTGFKFNEDGLTVSKTDSEMETQITEDGMTVSRNGDEVLIANNQGVTAANLHAKTYLIIGTYSRFEDYIKDGEPRTGCFWIGE